MLASLAHNGRHNNATELVYKKDPKRCQAEGADLGGNVDAFGRAAKGLATWQDALSRGSWA